MDGAGSSDSPTEKCCTPGKMHKPQSASVSAPPHDVAGDAEHSRNSISSVSLNSSKRSSGTSKQQSSSITPLSSDRTAAVESFPQQPQQQPALESETHTTDQAEPRNMQNPYPSRLKTPQEDGNGGAGEGVPEQLTYFAAADAGRLSFIPPSGFSRALHHGNSSTSTPFTTESHTGSRVKYVSPRAATSAALHHVPPPTVVSAEQQVKSLGTTAGLIYYSPPVAGREIGAQQLYVADVAAAWPQRAPFVLPGTFSGAAYHTDPTSSQYHSAAVDNWNIRGATEKKSVAREYTAPAALINHQQQPERKFNVAESGKQKQYWGGVPNVTAYPTTAALQHQYYTLDGNSLLSVENETGTAPSYTCAPYGESEKQQLYRRYTPEQEAFGPTSITSSMIKRREQQQQQLLNVSFPSRSNNINEFKKNRRMWACCGNLSTRRGLMPVFANPSQLSQQLGLGSEKRRVDISKLFSRTQAAAVQYYQDFLAYLAFLRDASPRYLRAAAAAIAPQQQQLQFRVGSSGLRGEWWTQEEQLQEKAYDDGACEGGQRGDILLPGIDRSTAPFFPLTAKQASAERAAAAAVEQQMRLKHTNSGSEGAWVAERHQKNANDYVAAATGSPYYYAGSLRSTPRACPTCGNSLMLVVADPALSGASAALPLALERDVDDSLLIEKTDNPLADFLQRMTAWQCSAGQRLGQIVDEELFQSRALFTATGDCVDQVIAQVVQGLAEVLHDVIQSFLQSSSQKPQDQGYPLYEPDPTLILKHGKGTSLTGNIIVDQINAFLDACFVDNSIDKYNFPKPPRIPDTQRTGSWLVDTTNAALDKLIADTSPPPQQPSKRRICPPIESFFPCYRPTPLLPPRPPLSKRSGIFSLLDVCYPFNTIWACPECGQPIKSAVCPVLQREQRERRKRFFSKILSSAEGTHSAPPQTSYMEIFRELPQQQQPAQQDLLSQEMVHQQRSQHPGSTFYSVEHCSGPRYYAPEAPAVIVEQDPPPAPLYDNNSSKKGIYMYPAAVDEGVQKLQTISQFPYWKAFAQPSTVCAYPFAPVCTTKPYAKGFSISENTGAFLQPRA